MSLPGGESNPGLPRDRRGYLPLYYRGCLDMVQLLNRTIMYGYYDTYGGQKCKIRTYHKIKSKGEQSLCQAKISIYDLCSKRSNEGRRVGNFVQLCP